MGTCKQCGGQGLWYGVAPHHHDLSRTGSIIGSTVIESKKNWLENFIPDLEGDGCGVYTCTNCKGTGKEPLEPYDDNECPHTNRFMLWGYLRCKNCGARYNDKICEWEKSPDNDD